MYFSLRFFLLFSNYRFFSHVFPSLSFPSSHFSCTLLQHLVEVITEFCTLLNDTAFIYFFSTSPPTSFSIPYQKVVERITYRILQPNYVNARSSPFLVFFFFSTHFFTGAYQILVSFQFKLKIFSVQRKVSSSMENLSNRYRLNKMVFDFLPFSGV